MSDNLSSDFLNAGRLVIKVGSALLIDNDALNDTLLNALASDIAHRKEDSRKKNKNKDVVIVSSGALALGCALLGLVRADISLEKSQAAAAVGQIALIQGWHKALGAHGLIAAQVLLTPDDTEQRRRYLNARATLQNLLALNTVPIINENDTVATQELRYGDNDRLAARVAGMISADCLVLLSDVDGLYTQSPKKGRDPRHIARVDAITPDIIAMAGESDSTYGSGGMKTKLEAARIATSAGCHMVLASGRVANPLAVLDANNSEAGHYTLFKAQQTPRTARKNWIAGSLKPAGSLTIDAGAEAALYADKSLLPVGITSLSGDFERGDCVCIINANAQEIARGLVAYSADEAARLIGRNSHDINKILGYQGRAAMIHRDDLIISKTDT